MFYNKFADLNLTTKVKIKEQNRDNTDKLNLADRNRCIFALLNLNPCSNRAEKRTCTAQ